MKLTDFDPRWLTPDVFIFRNPTGGDAWLTCKRAPMPTQEQYALIYEKNPEFIGKSVVMTRPDMAWSIQGNDFASMTVTPSVDHSPSGNWHGFITNGEVT